MKLRTGMITILAVFLISILGMFIMLSWQSRFFLAKLRHQSLIDVVNAGYSAESEIYDWVARFTNPAYTVNLGLSADTDTIVKPATVLADGTELSVIGRLVGNQQVLIVLAKRPTATTRIEIAYTDQTNETNNFDKVDIVIGFDCSGSMNTNSRIQNAQIALEGFLNSILHDTPILDRDKYYIGIIPFKKSAAWWGVNHTVNTIQAMYNQINRATNGVWNNTGNSPICQTSGLNIWSGSSSGETNMGSPIRITDNYFVPANRVKQAFILFTDGLPNTTLADSNCGVTSACSISETIGGCRVRAINYLKCSLATTATQWDSTHGYVGYRPVGVDTYAITVAGPPSSATEQLTYDDTNAVFNNKMFITETFANANASELPGLFNQVFQHIQSSLRTVTIQKIVPTPLP